MPSNKDEHVAGSQSAAAAIFWANVAEAASKNDAATAAYWTKHAVQASQAGQHMYPNA